MSRNLILKIRNICRTRFIALARFLGSDVIDYRTGQKIGRGLMIPWRGRIVIFGLREYVKPVFLPQSGIHYWKQSIGFTVHDPPDYPHAPRP